MTTILVLLFFVAYVSPVFFCIGLEKFATAPLDKPQGDERLARPQFAGQSHGSVLSPSR